MRKKRSIFLLCMAAIGIGAVWYGFMPVHYAKTFFVVPLSHYNALFDDLYLLHIQSRALLVRTFTATDKKGRIYVLGVKDKKARLIIIDPNGKIEKESFVYLKDRRIPRYCDAIAVSPSGNRIWLLCRHPDYVMDQRIVVYGKRMKCISEWRLKRELDFLWVSGEDTVYGTNVKREIFCFKMGQEQPKEFCTPFPLWFPFFKEGKFWYIDLLEGKFGEKWISIITWTPKEGKQIFSRFRGNRLLTQSIYWIDEKGNFYGCDKGSTFLENLLPSWLKGRFFRRILLVLGLSDRLIKKPKTVLIFSPKGELLEAIPLSRVIRPQSGEKLEYGELVKVDDKGIYWEVEKVNEPREYRIVRIVKKRRWQVWWDALRSRFNLDQVEGKG